MVSFIDDQEGSYGVESICRVLPIAPSTYYACKACQADSARSAERSRRDAFLRPEIERVWKANRDVYGARKVWRQLRREGIETARCTVERLMREMGLRGVVRGRKPRTTIPDGSTEQRQDLVARKFIANGPNRLWVTDLTCLATWTGFVYVAFIIDVFSRMIIGWRASTMGVLGRQRA